MSPGSALQIEDDLLTVDLGANRPIGIDGVDVQRQPLTVDLDPPAAGLRVIPKLDDSGSAAPTVTT